MSHSTPTPNTAIRFHELLTRALEDLAVLVLAGEFACTDAAWTYVRNLAYAYHDAERFPEPTGDDPFREDNIQ